MAEDRRSTGCLGPILLLILIIGLLFLTLPGPQAFRMAPPPPQFEPSLVGKHYGNTDEAPSDPSVREYKDAQASDTEGINTVEVFYGTDRQQITVNPYSNSTRSTPLYWCAFGLLALSTISYYVSERMLKIIFFPIGAVLLLSAILCASVATMLLTNQPTFIKPSIDYGPDRAEDSQVHYGTCRVSIPKAHKMGTLESPSILRFELNADPEKHFVLTELKPRDEDLFFELLTMRLNESKSIWEKTGKAGKSRDQIFIFVHGYNVSFDDAAVRTAQLSVDLKFPGVPMFYSWPSKANPALYTRDEAESAWTTLHLAKFINDVSRRSKASSVHLIAHSMGNRCVVDALKSMVGDGGIPDNIGEIVLSAADYDADTFKQVIPGILKNGKHVTLYVSKNDKALARSWTVHGHSRAGDPTKAVVIVPPMDTIDASAIATDFIGHSYYGDNRSVVSDIFTLLQHGHPPSMRAGINSRMAGELEYFIFAP